MAASRMRILYLSQDLGIPFDGPKGASAHIRAVVDGFVKAGHDTVFASPTVIEAGGRLRPLPEPGLARGLSERAPARTARALRHVWANAGVEAALERLVESWRPTMVYERYAPFAVAGGLVAARHGIRHLLEVNSPLAREGREFRAQALDEAATALEQTALDNAGAVIAVSQALRNELVADGLAPGKIHVVPNGFDPERFPSHMLRPCEGSVTFGFVGGLRPWHGIADLAAAFARVAKRCDARLLVMGSGPEAKHFKNLAHAWPGRIELTGALPHDEVARRMAEIDVAVAPYPALERFHYSPLKILEYMGSGRPIVASAIGQVSELLCHDETALLVPPGDAEALADAMARLARDVALRCRIGARAAEVAHARHSWSRRIEDILEIARGHGDPVKKVA
jgi:glycosyltransferase involved in cell wall biosynthesis